MCSCEYYISANRKNVKRIRVLIDFSFGGVQFQFYFIMYKNMQLMKDSKSLNHHDEIPEKNINE